MLETLKKVVLKSYLIRIVLSAVIIIVLLAVTKFAIFDVITGPAKIDMTGDTEKYEGKYVTIEVENILTDYVEHYTETTYKSGGKSTRVDGNSYIGFAVGDNDAWYFYSFYLPDSKTDKAYNIIDETVEYWNGIWDGQTGLKVPETIKVSGTWTKLDGTLLDYFDSTLEDFEIVAQGDTVIAFTIDSEKLGGVSVVVFWVCMIICLVLLVNIIWNIIKLLINAHLKEINKCLKNNSAVSMNNIEADFASAHKLEKKNVWVGRKWTVAIEGTKTKITANKDIVWAYYYSRTGRYSISQLRMHDINKKVHTVSLTESKTKEVLEMYNAEQPHMVTGYTSELETMYNKNFQEFLNLRYNPAKQQEIDNSYGNFENSSY